MARVTLVVFPMGAIEVSEIFTQDLAEILVKVADRLHVISAPVAGKPSSVPNVDYLNIPVAIIPSRKHRFRFIDYGSRFFRMGIIQFGICRRLLSIRKDCDFVIFYGAGSHLLAPIICSRSLGLNTIAVITGRGSMSYRGAEHLSTIWPILAATEVLVFSVCNHLVIESPSMKKNLRLQPYSQKILDGGSRFIDSDKFRVLTPLKGRACLVGYIGRLEKGKGVLNLVEAISQIVDDKPDVRFLIGGKGALEGTVRDLIKKKGIEDHAEMVGWIPHLEIPRHMNSIRLLVLPSLSEGLPTIVLEAMACGTPVLATAVGGLPDVIQDGETGFVLKDSSPDQIAKDVVRALNSERLETVASNGRKLISKEFSFEEAVRRWQEVLGRE